MSRLTRDLSLEYAKRKKIIRARLKEFKAVWSSSEKHIFTELCFCICTPQSKAVLCDKAVKSLVKSGILFKGNARQIRPYLIGVRFPNNKARFIAEARKLFSEKGLIKIKPLITADDIKGAREWMNNNVKGVAFKESSHFLRNIGFGRELAILDVHILKNMKRYGIVDDLPKTITPKRYVDLEEKLKNFSEKIKIPMDELDLLFWSMENGEVFK